MKTIEVKSLPKIRFAHEFSQIDYKNQFAEQSGYIEITYIVQGGLNSRTKSGQITANIGDVTCTLFDTEREVYTSGPHTHRTVCARVEWCLSPQGLMLPTLIKAADSERIRQLIDRAVLSQNSYLGSPAREAELFLSLLCEIDRAASKSQTSGEEVYARRAKRYVAKHLREPITQREIAKSLGITPGYLCAVFKKTQGQTLMQYINRAKLLAVRGIMEKENLHLYEAAALYGYTDPNYVSRLYKKIFLKNITEK